MPYAIRKAEPKDLPLLPELEQAAAQLFLETPYPQFAHGPNSSAHLDTNRDHVWVAVDEESRLAGFVIVRTFGDAVHIHEIDVHPRYARKGVGRLLIERVASWARQRRSSALTLTTYSDVAWNGPYYARLGFAIVPAEAQSAHLKETLGAEAAAGFPMAHRIAMAMSLR